MTTFVIVRNGSFAGISVVASALVTIRVGFGAVRRGSIVQLVVIGLLSGAIATCIAVLVPWMPVTATRAGGADRLHVLVRDLDLAVRVRRRRGGPDLLADQLPRRSPATGRTARRSTGTRRSRSSGRSCRRSSSSAICIVSAVVLAQNSDAGDDPLEVNVIAQQFAWTFSYDNGKTYYPMLRLPIDRDGQARRSPRTTSSTRSGCRSSRRSRTPCRASSRRS